MIGAHLASYNNQRQTCAKVLAYVVAADDDVNNIGNAVMMLIK